MHSPPLTMIELTLEQRDALADPGRITVIRAGPGTGKTRVFVTEFQRHLAEWSSRRAGIAALSFTNVARDEITKRLGGPPSPPHFVGTLDAFVWRFVVRPFAHVAGITRNGPRLIPAPLHTTIERPSLKIGQDEGDRESLFRLVLQLVGNKVRVMREGRWGLEDVADEYIQGVVEAKRNEWARNGRLTHSDCQAVAAKIMLGPSGLHIVERIVRRYPLFLVDEFQDTNQFLGRVLLRLLAHQQATAVVVGDCDQAIFAFGGADRRLFEKTASLSGAVSRPLRTTHRFGSRIAAVASALSRSGEQIVPGHKTGPGRTVLVVHNDTDVDLMESTRKVLKDVLSEEKCISAAFIARKNSWVLRAGGKSIAPACPLNCKAAQRLHHAVELLQEGNSGAAAGLVARDLAEIVLDRDDPTLDTLRSRGIEPLAWKRALHQLLFAAAATRDGETWEAWLLRMKGSFVRQVEAMGIEVEGRRYSDKFKRGFRAGAKDKDAVRRLAATTPELPPWEALTIHAAKGREFDGTIVYCPRPGGRSRVKCPSDEWWSEDPDSEEREIAYVAVTRARRLLVLCLHQASVTALRAKRAAFLELFEVVSP